MDMAQYRRDLDEEMDKDLKSWYTYIYVAGKKLERGHILDAWETKLWESRHNFPGYADPKNRWPTGYDDIGDQILP